MRTLVYVFTLISISFTAFAQIPSLAVPRLVRFNGTSASHSSTESVTLAVYREQSGGAPLWQEVQNVEVDGEGRYSLLMGSTTNEGVPVDLFAAGEPRWLGVRVNRPGEVEQSRVLLVSVPYALKAADAETLGGRPASAYLLAAPSTASGSSGASSTAGPVAPATNAVKPRVNSGTPGFIGVFTNSTDLGNSVIQQANGSVGIGTIPGLNASTLPSLDLRTNPFSQIGMAQTTDYLTFFASDAFGPAIYWNPGKDLRFGKGGAGLYNAFGFAEQMRIQSSTGNVGIGTQAPGSTLDVAGDINFTGRVRFQGSPLLQVLRSSPLQSIAIGPGALASNTTGSNNIAIGPNALKSNTDGGRNTAIGSNDVPGSGPLALNTLGTGNTAIGFETLTQNVTGNLNTGVGMFALLNNTGDFNTAVGESALENNTSGTVNIAIGANAATLVSGSNSFNIHIGSAGAPADSSTIRIGQIQTAFFAAGIRGITTANNDAIPVMIDSAGQLGTVSSSRRFKEDIADMGDSSRGLMQLRPVTYRYKQPFGDGTKPVQYGLIAEEVAEVYPDLVARSADGQIETVKYQVLDSMLLNEVQRLQRQNQIMLERLEQLEAALAKVVH